VAGIATSHCLVNVTGTVTHREADDVHDTLHYKMCHLFVSLNHSSGHKFFQCVVLSVFTLRKLRIIFKTNINLTEFDASILQTKFKLESMQVKLELCDL